MAGVLRETDYHKIREDFESDQQQLSAYSEDDSPTTIAVVSLPRDTNIEQICDEWMPALGMPERHLERFWSYKSGFRTNSAVDDPIQRAYDEARLDHWYERHIRTSDEAQAALSELVSRLENGEDITLVCFEERAEACHRTKLKKMIAARLSSEYQFREKPLKRRKA